MSTLGREARQTLKNAGITAKQWAIWNGQPDGKWYGDRCGCIDDRCIGYHHDENEECSCMDSVLYWYWKEQNPLR